MHVTATMYGLEIIGSYHYEAETGPTYACGGTPASLDVEAYSLDVDDATDGAVWCEALGAEVGSGAARLALGYARLYGTLPRCVSSWFMYHYEEEINEALYEAVQV